MGGVVHVTHLKIHSVRDTRHFLIILCHNHIKLIFNQLMGVHGLWDRWLLRNLIFGELFVRAGIRIVSLIVAMETCHYIVGGIFLE